jgi:hypothetical protein
MITLVRATRTSWACPSQWDAWDAEGNYYYLRFRHGCGSVTRYADENWVSGSYEDAVGSRTGIASFEHGDPLDGSIELDEFARLAGIELAPDIMITGFGDHIADELTYMGVLEMLPQGNEEE